MESNGYRETTSVINLNAINMKETSKNSTSNQLRHGLGLNTEDIDKMISFLRKLELLNQI